MPSPVTSPLSADQPIPTVGHHLIVPDWPAQAESGVVHLGREASKHLAQVLRSRAGQPISLTDGCGHIAQTRVQSLSNMHVHVVVEQTWTQTRWPWLLSLVQAIPKGKKLDEVIRRACELGVDQFYPILTDRCDRKLDANKAQMLVTRWQAIANSATEQSRRAWMMTVSPIGSIPTDMPGIVLWEEATTPLSVVLDSHDVGDLVFLIGPEGGLTAQEVEMSNMTPARLGPQILRTETAGVTAAALGAWHLGRLG